jgi:transposase InsO family protein
MSRENPLWGAPRIHSELLKLGIEVGETSVGKYIIRHRRPPSQTWRTFLENHMKSTVSIDIFTVPTFRFEILYIFLVLAHDRRRILHFGVTAHPTVQWTARQLQEAFPWDSAPKYLLRDRDRIFGADFTKEVEDLGIKEMLSAPRSPWQRAYIERVIGSTGFISLSAGWGLIRTDFLTPCYDITFSQSAEGYKRHRKADRYQDFRMLPPRSDEDIVFFGGKDYVRLFCALTETHARAKTVFYNSATAPRLVDCRVRKSETASRTNRHYECVKAFLDGRLCPGLKR